MDVVFYGANCLSVATRQTRFIIDDNMAILSGANIARAGDVALFTSSNYMPSETEVKLIVAGPGEYEIADVSIVGVAARAYSDEPDKLTATIYKLLSDDMRLLIVGHIYPTLSEAQLEQIGSVDVMVMPVGGSGYTLDANEGLSLIKKIEPKLVIPTHYADKGLKFEVPQQSLEEALKNLAMEPRETLPKLRLKANDFLLDTTQLVVLERQ